MCLNEVNSAYCLTEFNKVYDVYSNPLSSRASISPLAIGSLAKTSKYAVPTLPNASVAETSSLYSPVTSGVNPSLSDVTCSPFGPVTKTFILHSSTPKTKTPQNYSQTK